MIFHKWLTPSLGAALGLILLVGSGCASRATAPTTTQADRNAKPTVTSAGAPDPQARRVESLALFATGVSVEMRRGLEAALEYYQRAFEADPANLELGVNIARAYMSRQKFDEARRILQTTMQAHPRAAEPLFWLAVVHKTAEEPAEAVTALQRALKLDPRHINAIHLLCEMYLQQTNMTELVKVLDRAYWQKSEDASYWMRLGDLYASAFRQIPALTNLVKAGRVEESYEKARGLSGGEAEATLRLAGWHEMQGEYGRAAVLMEEVIRRRPDDVPMRVKALTLYLRAEDKTNAVRQLEEIIRREPLRPEFYNQLGVLYDELDQPEKAISNYQQSLTINPHQPEVYLNLTMLMIGQKRHDEARVTLSRWRERFPTDFRVPYLTGLILSDEKKYAEAFAAFRDAETLAAESPREIKLNAQFYFAYGAAAERSGDLETAARLFRKVIELDPNDHLAHNYLGYMWADKGIHLEEAYRLIKIANERSPNNGAYLDSLGWVLYRLGRVEEALPYLLRAAELEPTDPTVLDHVAEVLEKLGRRDEALQYLRRAVAADPQNADLQQKLQRLLGN
ncbi:MAG: tetratricopeptide repeat protein [Verrucomicrobiae bacterium]|nr:tetratricopeptide repeat protein [Verrucomicrobiae bacterium]